jgi:hypothetical protein
MANRSLFGIADHEILSPLEHPIIPRSVYQTPLRDANAFYYKRGRPMMPQDTFSLECDQWRHEDGEMTFPVDIHLKGDEDKVEGMLEFRIQARNLSKSAEKRVPVRIAISRVAHLNKQVKWWRHSSLSLPDAEYGTRPTSYR